MRLPQGGYPVLLLLTLAFAGEVPETRSLEDIEIEGRARVEYPNYFTCKDRVRTQFESSPVTLATIELSRSAVGLCTNDAETDNARLAGELISAISFVRVANDDWEHAKRQHAEGTRPSTTPSTEDIKDAWVRTQVDRVAGQMDKSTQDYLKAQHQVTEARQKVVDITYAQAPTAWILDDLEDELARYDLIRDRVIKAYCADRRVEIGAPADICMFAQAKARR